MTSIIKTMHNALCDRPIYRDDLRGHGMMALARAAGLPGDVEFAYGRQCAEFARLKDEDLPGWVYRCVV